MKKKNDAEVKFKITLDGNEAEKNINNLSKKTDELSKKLTNFGKTMTVGVTLPLTALATAGVKYNATMETYTANLTTLLGGNQELASKLLSDLKAMANTTPFETTSLVKATQTMLGFVIQVQDTQTYLKQLGDISMGDATKLESLTLAFSQVSSAGKLSGQDLLQMINAGFNPLNIISQKTGESMASLKERMGEGALSAGEVAQALQWATEEGGLFYGAMDKASQTTEGKLSTLADEFNTAVGELTTGLLPTFTKIVDKLTEMARWFSNLSPSQKDFIVKMGMILASIGPVVAIIGKLISVGAGIGKIITLIKSWNLVTKAMTIAQGALNAIMALNPITLIIIGITALIAIIIVLWNKCDWFREGVMSVINAIVGFVTNLYEKIVSIATQIFTYISNVVASIVNVISNIIDVIVSILAVPFDFLKNAFLLYVAIVATVAETIFNIVSSIITKILDVLGAIGSWVYTNVLSPIINFISSVITTIIDKIKNAVSIIKNIFLLVVTFIHSNVLIPIFNFFSSVWSKILDVISNVISKVKSGFSSAVEFLKTSFQNIKNFVSNIFSTIGNIIKTPINGVIDLINSALKGMNKIKVPDWVPGVGGKGINFKMIPKLATGTNYVEHEGLAYLHEGEAVVPKKYNPAIGGYGNGVLKIENSNVITLQVDKKTLAEVVNNYNNEREVAI